MITNMEQLSQQLDYSLIAQRLGTTSIVGFGESTHGTHEFFQTKTDLFKELVQNHGFNTFFLESVDDRCVEIDTYIQTGEGNPEELVNELFYVYRTEEILELVNWLREHHEQHPVRFIGIDERKYVDDYASDYGLDKVNLRDKRMGLVVKNYVEQDSNTKAMVWAHDTHVAAYIDPPEWEPDTRQIAMGENLRNWFGKDYYSVAQLFGSGYFNAALIEESGKFDNSKLVSQYARKVSKWFWENALSKKLTEPIFLEAPDFAGLIEKDKARYKRALGWGVQRSVMHDQNNVTYIDMSKAFNAVIFFPKATASHLLTQKQ
jgi:erythromycin esterase-like protein